MTEESELAQQDSSVQLFEAVENGSIEDVQKLIDAGADVSIQNKNGNTPLHRAVIHRNIKDITALIRADKNVINITNNNGETALHLAVDPLHPSEETRNQLTLIIEKLIEGGANVNANDIYGKTALQLACNNDFSQAVKMLIENGADPNIKLEDGSYEIMSTGKILSSQFLYAIALYSNNLDEKLIE